MWTYHISLEIYDIKVRGVALGEIPYVQVLPSRSIMVWTLLGLVMSETHNSLMILSIP